MLCYAMLRCAVLCCVLQVALKEEDYAAAARIRDHPFMRMHLRVLEHIRVGVGGCGYV